MTKKILSFVLAMTLIVSLFAGLTVTASAEDDGKVWTLLGGSDAIASAAGAGTVAITMTTSDGATFALFNGNGTSSAPTAVAATVEGNTLTIAGDNSTIGWTIEAVDGGYTITSAADSSKWLYSTNTNNGVRVGTNDGKVWTIDTASGYLKHVSTGRYMGVYNKADWRTYTTLHNNIAGETLQFWLLTDAGSAHEHDWSDWSSNDNGTHSRSCAGENCPVGTQTENCSFDEGTVTTQPTCADEGVKHFTCTVCGYEKDEPVPATGEHVDADNDGACDVCGEEMPEIVVYTLGTELHEGDQVVIYSVSGKLVLSTTPSGAKLKGVSATIEGEELTVSDNATAVMTVEFEDAQNFRLKNDQGKYLTSGATGKGVSFTDEPNEYSLWNLTVADANAKTVYIKNTNAKYNGNVQALEYYSGFTTYGENTTDIYRFQLYIHANEDAHIHEWTGAVTAEPSCTAKGVMTYTCSGCDETYTEDIPMIAHVDENHDGKCDTCQGTLYNLAQSLNDGDSAVLVTKAFGVALTGTESENGGYMAAAEINAQAGVTVPVAEDNVWTVKAAEEGFFLINHAGQYLYVNEANHLALGDETSENNTWKIAEPVEGVTATGAYLINAGGKYIEYGKTHNNYQTYGAPNEAYETWYAFEFYTLPAAQTEENATVYGYSISTSGNIAINVYLQLPAALAENGSITVNGTAYSPADVVEEISSGTVYKVSAAVPAKDINSPITVKVLDGEGQEVTLFKSSGEEIGTAYETSVANYLTWQAENSSSNENLNKLVKALFNYGSYAAFYWNVIDTLPELYTGEGLDVSAVTDLSAYASVTETAEDAKGVSPVGSSVTLKSETSLRIYFKANDPTNLKVYMAPGADYADGAAVAVAGEEVSYSLKSGKTYFVEIPSISASKLDESYSFAVCVTDEEGNQVYALVLKNVSALSYANKVLESVSDEKLQNVVQALYLYNQAANVYFNR